MNGMRPRPDKHHPVVELNTFKALAAKLRTHAPAFVEGMAPDDIQLRLSYAGLPPADRCYDYLKKLEACGWYGFTDSALEVFLQAHAIHMRAWYDYMKHWARQSWVGESYSNGDAVYHGESRGHVFIDNNLREMAAGYFRDADWVKTHGEQGGFLVFWEDLRAVSHQVE